MTYGADYYGAFLLDPDGNSVEAVHGERERPVPAGRIDHLWLRVRAPRVSRRFYTTITGPAGLRLAHDTPDHVQFRGEDYRVSLVRDAHPLTEHVHLAFAADADADADADAHGAGLSRPRPSPPATRTTASPASAPSTTRATTGPSCSIRTATMSRWSTTTPDR